MARTRRKYYAISEMGCIKIFSQHLACFFHNDEGDTTNTVYVYLEPNEKAAKHKHLGHFTVKSSAYLSGHDCHDEVTCILMSGRYFVHLEGTRTFHIVKMDDKLDS